MIHTSNTQKVVKCTVRIEQLSEPTLKWTWTLTPQKSLTNHNLLTQSLSEQMCRTLARSACACSDAHEQLTCWFEHPIFLDFLPIFQCSVSQLARHRHDAALITALYHAQSHQITLVSCSCVYGWVWREHDMSTNGCLSDVRVCRWSEPEVD